MLKNVLLFLGGNFKLIVKIFIEAQKPQKKFPKRIVTCNAPEHSYPGGHFICKIEF